MQVPSEARRVLPGLADGHALEHVGEEERNNPYRHDSDHDPCDSVEILPAENASVE
jgi:hypothetical protein